MIRRPVVLFADYFSMNSTGTISLARALPVGVVNTTYSVHAQDGGGLSGTAVVNIHINSEYVPSVFFLRYPVSYVFDRSLMTMTSTKWDFC